MPGITVEKHSQNLKTQTPKGIHLKICLSALLTGRETPKDKTVKENSLEAVGCQVQNNNWILYLLFFRLIYKKVITNPIFLSVDPNSYFSGNIFDLLSLVSKTCLKVNLQI